MFEYLKTFWQWVDDNPEKVSSSFIAVYMALLHRANQSGWKEKIVVIASDIQGLTGINSRTTMIKVMDELEKEGFVKTVSRTQNQYQNRVICLPNFGSLVEGTWKAREKQVEGSWTQSKTIKTNKTVKTIKTKGADLEKAYFDNPKVNEAFIEFLKNRVALKKAPTQKAADLLVNEARKLYKNADEAIQGINQSIMKGWAGLFPLDAKKTPKPEQPQTFSRSSQNHYV